jgi:hypothetical protein
LIQLTSAQAKDKARLLVGPDPERTLSLEIIGDRGGVADEIYQNLKAGVDVGAVFTFKNGESTVYVMESLRAFVNQSAMEIRVIADSSISGTFWEAHFQKGINKGRVLNFANSDLATVLRGDSDGPNENAVKTGTFIRCDWRDCEISLADKIENPRPIVNCEFNIDRIATLKIPNIEKSWESVVLVAKVRPDLRNQILSLYFGSEKLSPVNGMDGYYKIEINTTGLQDGPGPLSTAGYFRLKLKDGRVFSLRPKNKELFYIDQFFARNISTKVNSPFDDNTVKSLSSTADLFDRDGSARYVNPEKCQ